MVRILMVALVTVLATGAAHADPIVGNWKTKTGSTAAIASCGNQFCITLRSGEHNGKRIGTFKADGGGNYSGKITDPQNDKTYTGKASINGKVLRMSGCVLGVLCRGEDWSKL